jgi:hypothetical protein
MKSTPPAVLANTLEGRTQMSFTWSLVSAGVVDVVKVCTNLSVKLRPGARKGFHMAAKMPLVAVPMYIFPVAVTKSTATQSGSLGKVPDEIVAPHCKSIISIPEEVATTA